MDNDVLSGDPEQPSTQRAFPSKRVGPFPRGSPTSTDAASDNKSTCSYTGSGNAVTGRREKSRPHSEGEENTIFPRDSTALSVSADLPSDAGIKEIEGANTDGSHIQMFQTSRRRPLKVEAWSQSWSGGESTRT